MLDPHSPTPDDSLVERLLAQEEGRAGSRPPEGEDLPEDLAGALACMDLLDKAWTNPSHIAASLHGTRTAAQTETGEAPVPDIPKRLGKFELLRKLGEGGCGLVFLAQDTVLNRPVALKVPRPEALLTAELRQRFLREGQAAAGLDHPHIVPVHEAGQTGMICWLASAFCPGISLRDWIRKRRRDGQEVPVRDAAHLVAVLADAVAYTHRKGVLHRDLKPGNVLLLTTHAPNRPVEDLPLGDMQPRITDFGLAKILDDADGAATRTGAVFGTPQYMAPEQAQGHFKVLGPPCDVYALGVILYELLAGRVPFQDPSEAALLHKVIHEDPPAPSSLRSSVHPDLETICLKCLAKDPARRFASAEDLAGELRRFLAGEPIRTRPISRRERCLRWCRRHPTRALLVGVACMFLFVLLPWFAWNQNRLAELERDRRVAEQLAQASRKAEDEARRAQAAAEDAHRAAQITARTREYYALIRGIKERLANPRLGWRSRSLDDLRKAAALDIPERDPVELRTLAAACLAGLDFEPVRTIPLPFFLHKLAYSPDGKVLAVGEGRAFLLPCNIFLLDAADGSVRRKLSFSPQAVWRNGSLTYDGVRALDFSPQGDLYVGTRAGMAHAWKPEASQPHFSWTACEGALERFLFPDQHQVISFGGTDLRSWDRSAAPPKETGRRTHGLHHFNLELTPGGKKLQFGGGLFRVDPVSLRESEPHGRDLGCSMFRLLPHARTAVAKIQGRLQLLSWPELEPIRRLPGEDLKLAHHGETDTILSDRDGHLLFTASSAESDRGVRLWETATSRTHARIQVGTVGPVAIAWNDQRRELAVGHEKTITLYQVQGQEEHAFAAQDLRPVQRVRVHPDGRRLTTAAVVPRTGGPDQAMFSTWDLGRSAPPVRAVLHLGRGISRPELALRSPNVLAACAGGEELVLFHPKTLQVRQRHPIPRATVPAWTPDGTTLWLVQQDHVVQAWTWPDMKPGPLWNNAAARIITGQSEIYSLAPGNDLLLAGGRDGIGRLLDRGGKILLSYPALKGPLWASALDEKAGRIYLGSQEGELGVFDLQAAAPLQRAQDHPDAIEALALQPGGDLLASAGRDGCVHLYRRGADGLRRWLSLTCMAGAVRDAAFRPDGKRLYLAVDGETALRVWDLERLGGRLTEMGLERPTP